MPSTEITRLLRAAGDGDAEAFGAIAERVYAELVRVAERQLGRYAGGRRGVTLEPAALVNETLLKLMQRPRAYENRRHFYAFATKVMQRALLDYQRQRRTEKRGGDWVRLTLTGVREVATEDAPTVIELFELLDQLEALDARKAEVVRLKALWGLEMTEIAQTLGVSLATVERDWRFARNWLAARLRPTA
jgi:RNA polymerase sigma factor (TIGR02999 family)